MKGFVILNRHAGSVSSEQLADEIRSYFTAKNWEAEVKLVLGPEIEKAVDEGLASDADVIVSAGGDGTLRSIATRLHRKKKPLGILPLGTVNQLARNLNIPINVKGAVEVITDGKTVAIDTGYVNGEMFTCNVALGLPTYAMYAAEHARKRGLWGKVTRSVRALRMLLRLLVRLPVEYFEVRAGDTVIRDREALVYVSNNRFSLGALLSDEEDTLTSGTVTLYIPRTKKRSELLTLLFMAVTDRLNEADHMDVLEHRNVTVHMKRSTVMTAVDGEFIPLDTPLKFKSSPRSLLVRVPSESRQ